MTAAVLALAVTTAAGFTEARAAESPTLKTVLARAAAYVASFQRTLSGIVGEEAYVQLAHAYAKRGCGSGTPAGTYQATLNCGGQLVVPMRTELRSHLLLVRNGRSGYVQYRDVFEVDGRAIRDRVERLADLVNDPSADAEARKRRILEANARFNIGDLLRTMNVPLLALEFLTGQNQWRFSFKRSKNATARIGAPGETPPGTFRVSTDLWVIEYEEKEPRTLIRTAEGRDLKSRGRMWVEPDTGRVMMTELIVKNREVDGAVNVSFKSEPLLGMLVPVEMRESYKGRNGSSLEAIATYGRFRPIEAGK
jgi:hypothetical protein